MSTCTYMFHPNFMLIQPFPLKGESFLSMLTHFLGKKCHFYIGLRGKRPNPNRFLHKMEIFSAILVRSRPNLNGRFPTHKYMFHVNFMVIDPFPFARRRKYS